MQYPYLEHVMNHADDPGALGESDDPQKILSNARTEFVSLLERLGEETGVSPSETSEEAASDSGGPDLSDAKAAAKRALPPSKSEVTRRNVATSPSAVSAFRRNLPSGTTLDDALDQLE